jgi:hypothetical protein
MVMVLDRALQREMLERMDEAYPGLWDYLPFQQEHQLDKHDLIATLIYLQEHGLINLKPMIEMGVPIDVAGVKITAKGLDFLADDGGLTAILGVVTVKIHDDTLRQLLTQRIDQMPGSEDEKAPLRQALKELPPTVWKALVDKLVTLGVENLPGTVEALGHWIRAIAT